MSATYTFDVFSSLDGFASVGPDGDWGGYWGKQGPELLDHRLELYSGPNRLVLGARTFREFAAMLENAEDFPDVLDPWVSAMRNLPTTVISTSLSEPLDWPQATVADGDAIEVVAQMKEESDVPIRSHGSLSTNRALMGAGLVDRLQVTIYPVITGRTGTQPIFAGSQDFDLELLDRTSLGGGVEELVYRPTLH
ncbi:dihydrofolate reductase family protein [Brevibacterium sp. UCMA 11752]|uniref:dihydrofolate reductase family protein n=1 Tax=Brevibacterium sp. UCMA 11752 TaxID=2745946 RepID=UPI001F367437|nr:dihydrofolate reductase family protein [Brevibacterium sp. UCMA 11752]MCF2586272.1 dihydrofolate reductase family protein [Brevibacterium sp. UCMA 11752]